MRRLHEQTGRTRDTTYSCADCTLHKGATLKRVPFRLEEKECWQNGTEQQWEVGAFPNLHKGALWDSSGPAADSHVQSPPGLNISLFLC